MIVEILIGALFAGCGLFYIACIWATLDFFKPWQQKKLTPIHDCAVISASVSLMVPICGLDDRASRNWEAFCQQIDCGPYEVLFGIADPQDPAIPILQEIQAIYPDRVRLFINLPPRGANYKDSTLSYLLEAAHHEWLIFADSDISVTPHYIRDVMFPLVHHHADLITCAFIARQPKTLSSAIASLNRCCDFIPSALIARKLDGGLRFAIGMTIALHRDTLDRAGGLHLDRIGSDYNLGKRCAQAGAKIELLSSILESDTGNENLHQLYTRELRWSRTIRFNRGPAYHTMLFCFGSVYALILMVISFQYPKIPLWMQQVSFGLLVLRYLQAAIVCWTIDASSLMAWFPWLLVRDCASFVTWLIGCWGNHILWRGRHLKIEPDGIVTQITA
ncbi:MAG: glycosyltransferase [Alkalinema sp. CAN_BIN05]|nr:glycosyltransferase [Alkalinema sp. CAN_BIN05]